MESPYNYFSNYTGVDPHTDGLSTKEWRQSERTWEKMRENEREIDMREKEREGNEKHRLGDRE